MTPPDKAEIDPKLANSSLRNIRSVIPETINPIRIELDALVGAQNQEKGIQVYTRDLNATFRGGKVTFNTVVPKMIHADDGVQVMEFLPGEKLTDFFKNFPREAASVSEAVAKMWIKEAMFGTGFFHMDLHQGNILVKRMPDGGLRLTLIDFGMANYLPADVRAAMIRLPLEFPSRDFGKIRESMRALMSEPASDEVLNRVIEASYAAPKEWSVLDAVTDEMVKANLKIRQPLVDFKRGKTFVDTMLSSSGSKKMLADLAVEGARDALLTGSARLVSDTVQGSTVGTRKACP